MFKSDKSTISSSIDNNNSKPFWTTGDVLSGSVRLIVDNRINSTGLYVSSQCKEVAIVTWEDRDREINSKRPPKMARTAKREKVHLHLQHSVLGSPINGNVLTLDEGEYVFPFTVHIEEEADLCPPYCPVTSRAGYEVGVRWKLKAIARKAKMLQSDSKTERSIPVFPKTNDYILPLNSPRVMELSGVDYEAPKLSLFKIDKSRDDALRLFAQLTFSEVQSPQRPIPIRFHSNLDSSQVVTQVHSITINLSRKCAVNARGKTDVYTSVLSLGTVTATRQFKGRIDLSSFLTGFASPEILTSSFKSELIEVKYESQLVIEYIMPESSNKKKSSMSRKMQISCPVDVIPPWKQWVGRSTHASGHRQVQFNNERLASEGKAHSIITGRSETTGTTGATHSTNYSVASSAGTANSYEIIRPQEAIGAWISRWTGN